ncbi:MAG TPA: sialidase family protein, partial [Thermomicrobiales bacterium]|nr:sialidase family protein [Thermomicrobiales bacterium]
MRASTPSFRSHRSRRGRAALRRRWLVLALIGLLSSMIPMSRIGLAQDADQESPKPVLDLMAPIKNQLGASAWLAANGMDPRFLHVPAEEEARNVVDWTQYGAANGGSIGRSASGAPLVPFRSAAPSFSRNVIITRQFGLFPLQTEPSIAVDPTDPQHLVMGTIDYNFPSMSVYVSFDGGQTWEGPKQVPYFREDFSAAGDPGIAFDRAGNVYLSSISLGAEPFRIGGLVSEADISSMVVNVSTDGGLTWSDAISAARSSVETTPETDDTGRQRGDIAMEFLDKPWMTVGPNPDDPGRDTIYLAYTDFKTHYSLLYAD